MQLALMIHFEGEGSRKRRETYCCTFNLCARLYSPFNDRVQEENGLPGDDDDDEEEEKGKNTLKCDWRRNLVAWS